MAKRTIELDESEVALLLGEEDGEMTVRVLPALELQDDDAVVPEPYELAVALAMRLSEDPEFHEDVLEWYDSQDDEDEPEEEAEPPGKPG